MNQSGNTQPLSKHRLNGNEILEYTYKHTFKRVRAREHTHTHTHRGERERERERERFKTRTTARKFSSIDILSDLYHDCLYINRVI